MTNVAKSHMSGRKKSLNYFHRLQFASFARYMIIGLTNIPVINSTSPQVQVKCCHHSWEGVTSDRVVCDVHEIH